VVSKTGLIGALLLGSLLAPTGANAGVVYSYSFVQRDAFDPNVSLSIALDDFLAVGQTVGLKREGSSFAPGVSLFFGGGSTCTWFDRTSNGTQQCEFAEIWNGGALFSIIVSLSGQQLDLVASFGDSAGPANSFMMPGTLIRRNETFTISVTEPAAVPEPGTWAMVLLGCAIAVGATRRRKGTIAEFTAAP
jgi:hypothetical protein